MHKFHLFDLVLTQDAGGNLLMFSVILMREGCKKAALCINQHKVRCVSPHECFTETLPQHKINT